MKTGYLALGFAFCSILSVACGGAPSSDTGVDPNAEEAVENDGKADGVSKPLGLFESTAPASVGVGNPVSLEIKEDGTYQAHILVECIKAPCDPISQIGEYRFTKSASKRFMSLSPKPFGNEVKYAYTFAKKVLTLTAQPGGTPFELKLSTSAGNGCTADVEREVLKAAQRINDTAEVVQSKMIYGGSEVYADVMIVRVSDDTEPSDYVAIASHLRNDVVEPAYCGVSNVQIIGSGLVPETLDNLPVVALDAACKSKIEKAVLDRAILINETATIESIKPVYGEDGYADVVLVRVSDETEPSDYVVVASHDNAGVIDPKFCDLSVVEVVASGSLPEVPGL
jgi:hypothetical protein